MDMASRLIEFAPRLRLRVVCTDETVRQAQGNGREEKKERESIRGIRTERVRGRHEMRTRCCHPTACRQLYNTTGLLIWTSYPRDTLMDSPSPLPLIQRSVSRG